MFLLSKIENALRRAMVHLLFELIRYTKSGDDETRTHDRLTASQVLSQLSYIPTSILVFNLIAVSMQV